MNNWNNEVIISIFANLRVEELICAGLVCRSWHACAANDELWQRLYQNAWGTTTVASIELSSGKTSDQSVKISSDRTQDVLDHSHITPWKAKFKFIIDAIINLCNQDSIKGMNLLIQRGVVAKEPKAIIAVLQQLRPKIPFRVAVYLGNVTNPLGRSECLLLIEQ